MPRIYKTFLLFLFGFHHQFTSTCYAQVEVSLSLGALKNFAAFEHNSLRGPSGKLLANLGDGDPAISIQAAIPLQNNLQLQAGIRAMSKGYLYKLRFEYPDQFVFENRLVSWGNALELPVHIVYEIPTPVFGRTIKLSGGASIGRNTTDRLSTGYSTIIYAHAPHTLGFSTNVENSPRETFLTPALEAGLEIMPLLFNNFGVRAIYHYDFIPTFGSVEYKNAFYFNSYGPTVQDFPEGIIKAKRTNYIMVQLNYRLPFWDKKRNAKTICF